MTTAAETHPRALPLRYVLLTLFIVVAGIVTYPLIIEICRHQALVELQAHDSIQLLRFEKRIPGFIAARIPEGWDETWFVYVNKIFVPLVEPDPEVDILALIQSFPEAKELHLDGHLSEFDIDFAILSRIKPLKNLEVLTIDADRLNGGFEELANLSRIKTLRIYTHAFGPEGLAGLSQLRTVSELEISAPELDGVQFDEIAQLKQLRRLSISCESTFDGDLTHLDGTEIVDCRLQLPAAGSLHGIRAMSGLKTLDVSLKELNDKDLAELLSLKSLEKLELSTESRLDDMLARFGDMPKLQELTICVPEISDAGIEALIAMRPLRSLKITSTFGQDWDVDRPGWFAGRSPLLKELRSRPGVEIRNGFPMF